MCRLRREPPPSLCLSLFLFFLSLLQKKEDTIWMREIERVREEENLFYWRDQWCMVKLSVPSDNHSFIGIRSPAFVVFLVSHLISSHSNYGIGWWNAWMREDEDLDSYDLIWCICTFLRPLLLFSSNFCLMIINSRNFGNKKEMRQWWRK